MDGWLDWNYRGEERERKLEGRKGQRRRRGGREEQMFTLPSGGSSVVEVCVCVCVWGSMCVRLEEQATQII